MYEIILFAKKDFEGWHHHIYAEVVGQGDPNLFRTKSSSSQNFSEFFGSAVVLSGKWSFYKKIDFSDSYNIPLTPGMYNDITSQNLPNTGILSVKLEAEAEEGPISEITLFDLKNFQGKHHHIFANEDNPTHPNLGKSGFNNITSAIIIKRGIWALYDGYDARSDTLFNILGPGMYSYINSTDHLIDDISSLKRESDCPKIILNEIILFDHQQFGGNHHHVFTQDRNLASSSLGDKVYSIIIKSGNWAFYKDVDFKKVYKDKENNPIKLDQGMYDDISDKFVELEAVSSIRQL